MLKFTCEKYDCHTPPHPQVARAERAVRAAEWMQKEIRACTTMAHYARGYIRRVRKHQQEKIEKQQAASSRDQTHRRALAKLSAVGPPGTTAHPGALPYWPPDWALTAQNKQSWLLKEEGEDKPLKRGDGDEGREEGREEGGDAPSTRGELSGHTQVSYLFHRGDGIRVLCKGPLIRVFLNAWVRWRPVRGRTYF
ncbi:hypothetical protein T492DRAFT_128111 [Pavlovales sp. CCMP2436]|nr:hypothetical protein T492DRAFT_128111 [Pavlovales sp. CCMP2436]